MSMSRCFLTALLLSFIACGFDDRPQNRQSQVQTKPVVSIVPVIDNTNNTYAWNLSDELSSAIYNRIARKDRVIVNRSSQVRSKANQIAEGQNPFGPDVAWMKKVFQGDQFVAFLELVEHEEVPQQSKKKVDVQNWSADLNMSMRIRVLDLRGNEPKAILQEIVRQSHYIPRPFAQPGFFQVSWSDECFNISPIGLAHSDFTKEIALHIEDYILRASR
jgi:hypothetical protein